MRSAAAFALILLTAASASAQPFEAVGARALGMGGAFVAVADDASATWWNPAGLASGPIVSVVFDRSTFDTGAEQFGGAFAPRDRSGTLVAFTTLPLGVSYTRLRSTWLVPSVEGTEARSLVTHHGAITVVQTLWPGIVAAANLKYVRGSAFSGPVEGQTPEDAFDRVNDLIGRSSGAFDADLGLMARKGPLKAGLTVRNIREPEFETADGVALSLPRMVRAGVSYAPYSNVVLAADLDLTSVDIAGDDRRMLAFGGEYRVRLAAVRAGMRLDTDGEALPSASIGASYAVRNGMWVDLWATLGGDDAERGWGASGRIVF